MFKIMSHEETNVKHFKVDKSTTVRIMIGQWDEPRNLGSISGKMQCIFAHSKTSRIALGLTMSRQLSSRSICSCSKAKQAEL